MADLDIRALQQDASAVVAEAAAGATFIITDGGRGIAQLTPLPTTRLQQLLDTGRARPARRRIDTLASPRPGPGLSAALARTRLAERDE